MKKIRTLLAVFILTALFSCTAAPQNNTPYIDKYSFLQKSSVAIYLPFSIGSGIIIDEDVIVTCKHVVQNDQGVVYSDKLKIVRATGKKDISGQEMFMLYEGRVDRISTKYDLALIKMAAKVFDKRDITQISIAQPKFDDVIYYSGFIPEFGLYITRGYYNRSGLTSQKPFMQVNLPVTQGASGGGIYNGNMQLIGIIRAHHKTNNSMSMAETSGNLIKFLHDNE